MNSFQGLSCFNTANLILYVSNWETLGLMNLSQLIIPLAVYDSVLLTI